MTAQAVAHPGWDRRRLLYGDWSWLVRDGIDVIRVAFITGTVLLTAEGHSNSGGLIAASAVLLVARIVDLPRWFDFSLTVAMTLIAWGSAMHLYGGWFYYDKVVHGLSPIGYAPVLYIVLVRLGVVPDPGVAIRERRVARIAGIFIVTLAIGIAVGAVYENIEWLEDKWDILGGHFVQGLWDTETDLLCDTGGSLVGATFLTVWALRGWSSRRVTVVPAPMPQQTAVQAAVARLEHDSARPASTWERRLTGLPLAAQGAVAAGAGVLLLALPSPSLRTVGVLVGGALLISAAVGLTGLRRATPADRRTRLAETAALAVVGTLMLAWPAMSQRALLYALGAASLALACAEAASLTNSTAGTRARWLGGVTTVVLFLFGIAMLASPQRSLDAVVMLLGLFLVVLGTLRLWQALEERHGRTAHGTARRPPRHGGA
ncbi:MAG TPA: DUF308 domain-containing protein [Gaiellaceae bacterium]|nr:DUF308 domain-containing protein [Gaiellaceae bacterium]